jgi:protein gp37
MSNLWLGVSVEDQAEADERIPPLLQTPAAVRWISAEPLLGPVKLPQCTGDTRCQLTRH